VVKLGDIAGIFSRPFIVGYLTPALIAWSTVILLTLGEQPERFHNLPFLEQLIVVVILAALTAALLSVLRYHIRFAFIEGNLLPKPLFERFLRNERARFAALSADDPEELKTRDLYFPEEQLIRPTRFGNVVGAYEAYPFTRFGIDYVVAWKRIDVLLSPREVELQALARSDVDALLNLSTLAAPAALAILVDRLVHLSPLAAVALVVAAAALPFYRLAVVAERRLGAEQRASFDLHRFELYRRFGIRWPSGPAHEKIVARWLNTVMLWPGYELPSDLWTAEYPPE
jgi:hypothetical protein